MSQTLFCWIWGLTVIVKLSLHPLRCVTNLILLDLRSDHLIYASEETYRGVTNLILLDLRSDREKNIVDFFKLAEAVTNLILLDLRSDLDFRRRPMRELTCHKPYFVGFEVWPGCSAAAHTVVLESHKPYFVGFEVWPLGPVFNEIDSNWCHKPYFVGFEVWPADSPLCWKYKTMSQTLFCWIWGLT